LDFDAHHRSVYYRAIRKKDNAQSKTLEQIEDFAQCCGFGPPVACDGIENGAKFPSEYETEELLGKDMTRRRVTCGDEYDCDQDDSSTARYCWYPAEAGTCEHFAEGDVANANPLGCRYDWGVGSCLDADADDSSKGCAWYFEDTMNDKIYGHGIAFVSFVVLEVVTVISACCFCWKRKSNDVLPISYIYDEPWDPVKEHKLALHVPNGAPPGMETKEGSGNDDDDAIAGNDDS